MSFAKHVFLTTFKSLLFTSLVAMSALAQAETVYRGITIERSFMLGLEDTEFEAVYFLSVNSNDWIKVPGSWNNAENHLYIDYFVTEDSSPIFEVAVLVRDGAMYGTGVYGKEVNLSEELTISLGMPDAALMYDDVTEIYDKSPRLQAAYQTIFDSIGSTPSESTAKPQTKPGLFDGYVDISNKTGYEIYYLYVSHEQSDSWEEDMLGEDTLGDGETFRVDVTDYPSSIFDVRLEDEDGDTYTFYNVDIATEDLVVTLDHLDEGSEADSSGFEGYIEVTNKTGFDIHYLYVSHEDSDDWEEDVLGDKRILSSGDSVTVNLSGYSSSVFDVRAQDEDGDTYTVYGIDVAESDLTLDLSDMD